jgi:hypothetical protein
METIILKTIILKTVSCVYLTDDDLSERYKDVKIINIELEHFGHYIIDDMRKIDKADLVIYKSSKGVSKVLQSRY